MKHILLVLALLAVCTQTAAALTVDEVIMLSQAGVSVKTIQTQIEVTGATFKLSAADIAKLAKAKVPGSLIQLMIKTQAPKKQASQPTQAVEDQDRGYDRGYGGRGYGGYGYGGSSYYYGTYSPYYGYSYPLFYGTSVFSGGSLFLHQAATAFGLTTSTTTFGSGNSFSGTFSGTLPSSSGFTVTSGSSFTFAPTTSGGFSPGLGLSRGGSLSTFKALGSK